MMNEQSLVDVQSLDVLDLLPQRPPFIMIDKLVYCDMKLAKTIFQVRDDNVFCFNGHLQPAGLVENIAQTSAARMGYVIKYILKQKIKLGFIGTVRNCEFYRVPIVGETLTTTIEVIDEVFNMMLVKARIMSADELIVESEMKIALSDIEMD